MSEYIMTDAEAMQQARDEFNRRYLLDGEVLVQHVTSPDGMPLVRFVEPEQAKK